MLFQRRISLKKVQSNKVVTQMQVIMTFLLLAKRPQIEIFLKIVCCLLICEIMSFYFCLKNELSRSATILNVRQWLKLTSQTPFDFYQKDLLKIYESSKLYGNLQNQSHFILGPYFHKQKLSFYLKNCLKMERGKHGLLDQGLLLIDLEIHNYGIILLF